jgi:heat-inducible transcriptional repressor
LTSDKYKAPSNRAQLLLKVLVERYISDGYPIGSKALALESGLDLSSASIRNTLVDLEDLGFISSIHTSSGRIPTEKGYRFFVDTLMRFQSIDDIKDSYEVSIDQGSSKQSLIHGATQALSGMTKLVSLISIPKHKNIYFKKIEFIRLSENRVLAIIILDDYEVQNRVLHLDKDFTESELVYCANFLTKHLVGKLLTDIRSDIMKDLVNTKQALKDLMVNAISLAEDSILSADDDVFVSGETNLMAIKELADIKKLKQLFDAFGEKRDLLHLLDKTIASPGVKIYIGKESGHEIFEDCSVITAPYIIDDRTIGVLGVIGPTRMPYDRVIPIVDITAKFISNALKSST